MGCENPVGMTNFVGVGVNPPNAEELDVQNPVGMTNFVGVGVNPRGFRGKSAVR